jgi:hypothetical protein
LANGNTGQNPWNVISPRWHFQLIDVLHESQHWSMAFGRWRENEAPDDWRYVLCQRWNGWQGSKGNPISTGWPTWFVLPDDTYRLYLDQPNPFVQPEMQQKIKGLLAQQDGPAA